MLIQKGVKNILDVITAATGAFSQYKMERRKQLSLSPAFEARRGIKEKFFLMFLGA